MTETSHFGSRDVPLGDKQALVDDVFRSVARRYDLMNDLMSFGLHRAWKDALVTAVDPPRNHPFAVIDIAGGTGDVAFRLIAAGGEQTRVTVCDINADMLAVGRERAARRSARRCRYLHRGQCRGAAVRRPQFRRRHYRVRHPQRAAHRYRARRGVSRAQDRRQVSLPGILRRRRARPRPASTISTRSTSSPRSAVRWPATPTPIAIWWNRSAAFRARRRSPRCCAPPALPASRYKVMSGGIVALHSGWRL